MIDTQPSIDGSQRRFPIQRILIEAFSILFAVLLALGVDEWRETRQLEVKARNAYDHILEEVRSNKTILTAIHANNLATVSAMQSDPAGADDSTRSFIPALQLQHAAWETAKGIGVFAHMEYAIVLKLSDAYSIQGIYRELGFQMTQAMMQGSATAAARGEQWDESLVAESFGSWFSMLVSAETSLLKKYDAILEASQSDMMDE